jgi:hypothetical protein
MNRLAIKPKGNKSITHDQRLFWFVSVFIPFFLFHIMLQQPLVAQNDNKATLTWKMNYKAPANSKFVKFFGWNKTGFYACRQKDGATLNKQQKLFLEKYGDDGKLIRTREISLKHKGKDRKLEEIFLIGGKIFLFTSYHNLRDRKNYLFAQEIQEPTLTLSNKLIKVSEASTSNAYNEGEFSFQFSRDSQFLLIYAQHPLKKKDAETFTLSVLSKNLSPVWEKEIALPYPNKNFTIEECRIDKKGEVFLMGVAYEDMATTRREGSPDYKYTLFHYSENGNKVQEYSMKLEDLFITDLTFRKNNEHQLVFAGFYSEKNSYSIRGVCYFRIDLLQKTFVSVHTKPFDFDFITLYYSANKKRKALKNELEGKVKKQAELYNYNLHDLILRNDGGAVLVAEQYFVERIEWWDNWTGRRYIDYYYHYNDIILANIKPDGSIQWTARAPKEQVTRNDKGVYSSYSMATAKDRLLFLYNDFRYDFGIGSTGKNPRNADLKVTEILLDGTTRTYVVAQGQKNPAKPIPVACKQVSNSNMLIYGESGRQISTGILKF